MVVAAYSQMSSARSLRALSGRSGSRTSRNACSKFDLPIPFSPTITALRGIGSISSSKKFRKFRTRTRLICTSRHLLPTSRTWTAKGHGSYTRQPSTFVQPRRRRRGFDLRLVQFQRPPDRISLSSEANPCGSMPPFHVHHDGQMTVRRSWNQSLGVRRYALTCNSLWSYGDSNPRPLACHAMARAT